MGIVSTHAFATPTSRPPPATHRIRMVIKSILPVAIMTDSRKLSSFVRGLNADFCGADPNLRFFCFGILHQTFLSSLQYSTHLHPMHAFFMKQHRHFCADFYFFLLDAGIGLFVAEIILSPQSKGTPCLHAPSNMLYAVNKSPCCDCSERNDFPS